MGPADEGYELEKQWFEICRQSHNLWCLCPDWRQHITPGCGIIHAATDSAAAGPENDGLDEIMVNFDVGDPDGDAAGQDDDG